MTSSGLAARSGSFRAGDASLRQASPVARSTRRRPSLTAFLPLLAALLAPSSVHAQPHDDLEDARRLFNEAYKDEQEGRVAEALEKFRKVAKVKESGSVRYRVASCLEVLGKLREARDEFRALVARRAALPANQQDVADSAAERAHSLDQRIPRLAIIVEDKPLPRDLRLSVDGAPVPEKNGAATIELDPGDHVVLATSSSSAAYEAKVRLSPNAGEVRLAFHLAGTTATGPRPARSDTLGYVALGVGGALVATGAVLLLLRESAIDDVEDHCPGNVCPPSARSAVESDIDRAEAFGVLGITSGIVGLLAAGAGAYLLLRHDPDTRAEGVRGSRAPTALGGWQLGPRVASGGGILAVGASF